MTPRLTAISGPHEGQTFPIGRDRFTVGREDGCDLQIPLVEVSRQHCEIVREPERYLLRDLGSRHGTFVNGRPVHEKDLIHSDLLTLGTSTFLFLLDDSSSGVHPAPESGPPLLSGTTLERKLTEVVHLDAARLDAALPKEARLARELHTLVQLATTLLSDLAPEVLAERLLDACFAAVPAERGALLLLEPGVERPAAIAERGDPQPSQTVLARVLEAGVGLLCPRQPVDGELVQAGSVAGVGAILAAPLASGDGEPLGAVYLDRRSEGFTESHLELLTAIAGIASLAFQNAFHLRWLRSENRRLRDEEARHEMIGESAAIRRVFDFVARVARADSTVLFYGESGTGKELVARAVHRSSPRCDGPFVAVNCATLSETLLESELFGHEKGAFTGALARKVGKMEAAHRGTLFLDEVAETPFGLQAKLLRALQEREIERVGGERPIKVDVRVVAATHRDLEQAVKDGELREDLYYRLNVIPCTLPPLRERREDVPLLASYFARRHGEKLGLRNVAIEPAARRCLMAYRWPGNVRELSNVIERAVVLGDGEVVRREDLPEEVAAAGAAAEPPSEESSSDFQAALVAYKKLLILDAWRESGEDYGRTAERLGVHVNSLHRMLKSLGMKDELRRKSP